MWFYSDIELSMGSVGDRPGNVYDFDVSMFSVSSLFPCVMKPLKNRVTITERIVDE